MMTQMSLAAVALFLQASVFGDDGRSTFGDYADRKGVAPSEIYNRFAATGIVVCGEWQASGQLTGASNIVSTADHLFEDEETCVVKSVPSECVFRPVSSKKTRSYKVATRVASGFQCGKKKEIKPGDDWAVLRLKESVPGVAPYKLPIHESSVLEFDEKVLSVLGASRDFPKTDKKGIKFFPPTIEECAVKNIRWVSGGGAYVKTDCDGSLLSSGGSLLRPTNDGDVLLGVFKGTQETTEMANAAAMTNRRTQKTYNSEDWFSVFVSVSGDFLKALQAAIRNP